MGKARSITGKGQGWHQYMGGANQHKRKSDAKKYGKAGGKYSERIQTIIKKNPKLKNLTFKQLKNKGIFLKYQGDNDKDGTPNIKDCQPLNPKKQDLSPVEIAKLQMKYPNLRFDRKGKVTGARITKKFTKKEAELYIQGNTKPIQKDLHNIIDKSQKYAKTKEDKRRLSKLKNKIKHVKNFKKLKEWMSEHRLELSAITGFALVTTASLITHQMINPSITPTINFLTATGVGAVLGGTGGLSIQAWREVWKDIKKNGNRKK